MSQNLTLLTSKQLNRHYNNHDHHVQFVRPGEIVLPCARDSDWLVIVKTGSCKVIGEIRDLSRQEHRERLRRRTELKEVFPLVATKKEIEEEQKCTKSALALGLETGELREVMKANLLAGVTEPDKLVPSSLTNKQKHTRDLSSSVEDYRDKIKAAMAEWGGELRDKKITDYQFQDRFVLEKARTQQQDHSKRSTRLGIKRTWARATATVRQLEDIEKRKDADPPHESRLRYLQISQLQPGNIFGLETLYQKFPTRLSLVSEGACCFFISKKLFRKECNTRVLKVLADMVISFPTEMYMKQKIKEQRNWIKYKKDIIKDVVKSLPHRTF